MAGTELLDSRPSDQEAWDTAGVYAAEIRRLGMMEHCGVTVERRRLPGEHRSGQARYTYDVVLHRYSPAAEHVA